MLDSDPTPGKFIAEKRIKLQAIPPQNLCFIGLEDWDKVIQNVKNRKGTLSQYGALSRGANQFLTLPL